jgi:hypothetical protein
VVATITNTGDGTEEPEECTGDAPVICTRAASLSVSATDPRLSGTMTERVTEYVWPARDGIIEAYATKVVNDEGAWVGTGWWVEGLGVNMYALTGERAYEGLTAFITVDYTDGKDIVTAVIVDGVLPFPELPTE